MVFIMYIGVVHMKIWIIYNEIPGLNKNKRVTKKEEEEKVKINTKCINKISFSSLQKEVARKE